MTALESLKELVDYFNNLTNEEAKELDNNFYEYLKNNNPEEYDRISKKYMNIN